MRKEAAVSAAQVFLYRFALPALLGLSAFDCAVAAEPGKGLNVLLIVCDDLNTHVSTSGYQPIHTPNFEALAREGQVFTRAYCQYPVCGPSRASFLTGLYPETTGVMDNKEDFAVRWGDGNSLQRWFQQHGYYTSAVGKVHHGAWTEPEAPQWSFNHDSQCDMKRLRLWHEECSLLNLGDLSKDDVTRGPLDVADGELNDGENAARINKWLRERTFGEQPFCLVWGVQQPHGPLVAPRSYFELYPQDTLRLDPNPADDWNDLSRLFNTNSAKRLGFEPQKENEPLRRELIQAYHACVSYADAQIGLVLAELKAQGLWENTIVVLTSDHGFHLGEHFMWGKSTLFEESARVPMIVRVPGRTTPGSRSEGLVDLIDLFPTVADAAGLPAPDDIHGHSFTHLIDDPAAAGKGAAYTIVQRRDIIGRAIRTGRWCYIHWGNTKKKELYDHQADPHEFTNLARKPEYAEVKARLARRLALVRATAAEAPQTVRNLAAQPEPTNLNR